MLDQNFCEFLAYKLCNALENVDSEATKGFWCDGVLPPANDDSYSQKSINDHRQVALKAFIGKDGQSVYELILKFGNKALSRYARNLDLKDCIPAEGKINWFDINVERRKIEIQLD